MSLYSQFKTDTDVETQGLWLEYGETDDGKPIRIRIARAGGANKAYTRLMEAKVKPYRRMIQNETIETAVVEKILKEVFAKTVVLGWENVQGPDGKDMPFNEENCIKLFEDLPDLFRDVQEQSQRQALFRAEVRKADGKN